MRPYIGNKFITKSKKLRRKKMKKILTIVLTILTLTTPSIAVEVKLTASDGAANDYFGYAVAIDGSYAIVGARCNDCDSTNTDCGAAYIFKQNGNQWIQTKIIAKDKSQNDYFGYSVDISGDYAIVGAYADDIDSISNAGSAYIFKRDGEEWKQTAQLFASTKASNDQFGSSVSISGDYAIVGAQNYDFNSSTTDTGAAFIYKRENETWTQMAKIFADDKAQSDYFGEAVCISGDYAIVGARLNDDKGSDSGSVYIFKNNGTQWTQQQKLTANDGAASDHFGNAVSISGDYAIVGAYNDDNGIGSAYIFKREEAQWTQLQKLIAYDGAANDHFGSAVSISDNYAIIGAESDDDKATETGSVYIFKKEGSNFITWAKHTAWDGAASDYFGHAVAISDHMVIIGSRLDDDRGQDSGSAYIDDVFSLRKPVTIAGFIRDINNAPIPGAQLVFSHNAGEAFTNSAGYYSHDVIPGWAGSVMPEGNGYKYSPSYKYYDPVTDNLTDQHFTGYKFTISGHITDQNGHPIPDTHIIFSNNAGIALTDENGFYSHDIDYLWSGTTTPQKNGFDFLPQYTEYHSIASNYVHADFSGDERTYEISGIIIDQDSNPLSDVNICFGDTDTCTVTSSLGQYRYDVPFMWTGAVIPQKMGYLFYPTTLSYTDVSADAAGQNISATIQKYIISGVITEDNTPLAGVTIFYGDDSQIAIDESGQFSLEMPFAWQGVITPQKTGYLFQPHSYSYNSLDTDQPATNFSAEKEKFIISGKVTDQNGNPVSGVSVKFTNSDIAITDSSGIYSHQTNFGWTGKAEIFYLDHAFAPPSKSYNYIQSDQLNQDYTAFSSSLPCIIVEPDKINVSSEIGSASFKVYITPSSTSWEMTPQNSWLQVQKTSQSITVNYTGNTQETARIGTITVSSQDAANSPQIITIIQEGKPADPVGPGWEKEFDPTVFQYNASLTCIVKDDNNNLLDIENDILAAFVGDECRGMAKPIWTSQGNRYFLQIWSNQSTGEEIIFKHYDSTRNRVNHNIKYPIEFQLNTSLGTILEPHELIVSDFFIRTVLNKHWNWITINVTHTDMSVNSILSSIGDKGIIIIGQEGYAEYDATFKTWTGSLSTIKPTAMYMIKTNQIATLEFSGNAMDLSETPIPLNQNWNWIGYLPDTEQDLNDALSSVNGNAIKICSQRGFADYLDGHGWYGSLQSLMPNRGYMLKMDIEDTLYYPEIQVRRARTRSLRTDTQQTSINGWTFDSSLFQHQSTITSAVELDGEPTGEPGDALVAFVQGECRGIAKPVDTPYGKRFFLQIWGSENETITVKYYHASDSKVYELDFTKEFSPNMIIGSISEPQKMIVGQEKETFPQDWTIDTSKFQHQATILSAIKLGGQLTGEAGDKLAIFVDNECRGIADPVETPYGKRFFLQAWSNETQDMTLKYYRSADDNIYDIEKTITFTPDMELGSIQTPENFDLTGLCSDYIEFIAEKNTIISEQEDTIENQLQIINAHLGTIALKEKIIDAQAITITSQGLTINEQADTISHQVQEIKALTDTCNFQAYTITQLQDYISRADDTIARLEILVAKYARYSVTLSPGWHLMSSINADVAPTTIPDGCFKIMYEYRDGAYKPIEKVSPSRGFWVKIDQECEFIVDGENVE
jgi:protocatechuate 3,4-dioxygenase beta subunit